MRSQYGTIWGVLPNGKTRGRAERAPRICSGWTGPRQSRFRRDRGDGGAVFRHQRGVLRLVGLVGLALSGLGKGLQHIAGDAAQDRHYPLGIDLLITVRKQAPTTIASTVTSCKAPARRTRLPAISLCPLRSERPTDDRQASATIATRDMVASLAVSMKYSDGTFSRAPPVLQVSHRLGKANTSRSGHLK